VPAESIAPLADPGESVSSSLPDKSALIRPIQRGDLDLTAPVMEELDNSAKESDLSCALAEAREFE
jgi:hypothetical protein